MTFENFADPEPRLRLSTNVFKSARERRQQRVGRRRARARRADNPVNIDTDHNCFPILEERYAFLEEYKEN
jgi:hypothetical protein